MLYSGVFRFVFVAGIFASMLLVPPLPEAEVLKTTEGHKVSDTHEQRVIELFEVMNLPAVYRREVDALVLRQKNQIQHFEYFEDVIRQWAIQVTGWEALQPKIAALYKTSFTEQELNDMLRFYRSPAGLKFLQLQPVMATKMRQIGAEAAQEHREVLKNMLRERAEELRKSGVIKNNTASKADQPDSGNKN